MRFSAFNLFFLVALFEPRLSIQAIKNLLRGYTLRPRQSPPIYTTMCSCVSKCNTNPECLAYSIKKFWDSWECELFMNRTRTSYVTTAPDTFLKYLKPTIGDLTEDGLFYFSPEKNVSTFDDAKQLCAQYHGFRLAMFKKYTNLYSASMYWRNCSPGHTYTLIDMKMLPNGTYVHSDGTKPSSYLISDIEVDDGNSTSSPDFFVLTAKFSIYGLSTNQTSSPVNFPVLCQANFLNIYNY